MPILRRELLHSSPYPWKNGGQSNGASLTGIPSAKERFKIFSKPPADLGHPLSRMGLMSEAVTRSELSSAESATARKLTCGGRVEKMEHIHRIILQLACGVEDLPSWVRT
jgi:hypothetical protein